MGTEEVGTPLTASDVVLATAGTAVLGAAAHLTNVSPWWAAAAAAPAAVSFVRSRVAGLSAISTMYRLGCWACTGTWVWHAADRVEGPWTWGSFVALGAGAATAATLTPVMAWRDKAVAEKRALFALRTANARRIAEWSKRLTHVCGLKGHRVDKIIPWANGYGYTVIVNIVGTKIDWRRLKPFEARLATDADLPHGCGVEVASGATRGGVELRVSTRDAFEPIEGRPLPTDDMSVRTSDEPISLGWHRDGDAALASILRQRWIVVAPPDQGKSNQLHTVIAGTLLTNDQQVRIIDLNGGGLAWSWLRPWINGQCDNPAIDWVGSTPEEAEKLAGDTLWEAKRRKGDYQHLLLEDDKLPLAPDLPGITLIVDEGAEVGGAAATPAAKNAARDIAELIRIGRSVGITVIQCYLRATIDMTAGTANKRLSGTRILMRVQDGVEGQHLFGQMVDPEDAPYPGCGWLKEFGQTPRPFRGWRTVGATIDKVAVATSDRRPTMFPSPNYAGRWERITLPGGPSAPEPTRQPVTTGGGPTGSNLDKLRAIRDRVKAIADRAREMNGDIRHDPDLAEQFEDVMKGLELPDAAGGEALTQRVPDRMYMAILLQGLTELSPDGVPFKDLEEAMIRHGRNVPRSTLYRWLKDDEHVELINGLYRWTGPDTMRFDGPDDPVRS